MYSIGKLLRKVGSPPPVFEADPAWVQSLAATVQAGFPSPAEDLGGERIDLNRMLIKHPLATYVMKVRGSSMREAGIDDGDVVLVDRAVKASHGHVIVARSHWTD